MSTSALDAPRARGGRTGRPPAVQLTPSRVKKICELVAKGVPQQAAAGSVGIPRRTFQIWLAAGREEGSVEPYTSLAEKLERALDEYHMSRAIEVSESGDARVALQVLERRFPNEWGQVQRSEVTVTARPMLDASKYSVEELALLMELLRKGSVGEGELPADGVSAVSLLELGSGGE